MKIVLTGTHFTPAQALAEELKKYPGVELLYIGRKTTMEGDPTPSVESRIFPKMGVSFIPIVAGRLRRYVSLYTLLSLLKIPVGFIQSFFILLTQSPDVVVSFGGYLGVPVVISAWLLSIPVVIHEQTLVVGLANRVSAIFADKIATSFDTHLGFPRGKVVVTGNPLRAGLIKRQSVKKNLILVLGGNQGSVTLNKAVWSVLENLTQEWMVIHQTGESKYGNYEQALSERKKLSKPQNYQPYRWINERELSEYYCSAKLCISRSGANTLYELAFFGLPTIVVPLPGLYRDEQMVNARYFRQRGLCDILEQSKLSGEVLLETVRAYLLKPFAPSVTLLGDGSKRLAQEVLVLGEHT